VKHVLCVHLHQLPIDRLRRRQPALRGKPFVLVQTIGTRQIVVHVTTDELPEIHSGMSLAEAKGRHLGLAHFPVAPADDLRALEAIGRWLMKFSPNISLAPPSSIFLDAMGVERLFGGIDNFRNRVASAIRSLRLKAGVAIAPTAGAAWAIAAFGQDQNPVDDNNLSAALAPLPTSALRLEIETIELLASLGVRTIGQVMRLDRQDLAVRFGWGILQRIDQAMGTAPEPLVFLQHHIPIRAGLEFEAAIESLEVVQLAVKQLVAQIVELLASRGLGARELRLAFGCPYAPSQEKTVRLTRPSRNERTIFNLLVCALDTIPLDDGAIGGVIAAELHAGHGVNWVELVESHVPERAFRCREEAAVAQMSPQHARIGEYRPLSLLPHPRAIRVIVTPSECLDGQPISFTDSGAVHRLDHVRGPERMTGEWWTGQHKTRDYFDALDTAGNRYWLFRVPETRRWYVHGIYE
jgi:protein ImuB